MIGAGTYAGLFVLCILGWPYALSHNLLAMSFAFGFNTLLFALVASFASSEQLTFWRGLVYMSGSMMTGCANITILLVMPVLTIVYVMTVFYCLVGLFRGKSYTEQRWLDLVASTVKGY